MDRTPFKLTPDEWKKFWIYFLSWVALSVIFSYAVVGLP